MRQQRLFTLLTVLALCGPLSVARAEEDITAAAKKIFAAHQDSVIWISAAAKLSLKTAGGTGARSNIPDQEKKLETPGTIIDASGLVVTSLSTLDPSSAVDGQEFPSPGGPVKISASAQITEVKLIMPDGTEVPADIVLKDTDLDLAFVRARTDSPEAKGVKFHAVDLTDSTEGHMLDEVVALGRTGEYFSRQPSVVTSLVTAETKKPRHFLRVPTEVTGGPVFAANGKLLGITVLRRARSENQGGQLAMLPAVLPASDIAPVAAQALKAKVPESAKQADEKSQALK